MFIKVKGKRNSTWHVFGETTNVTYMENIGFVENDPVAQSKIDAADHYDEIISNAGDPQTLLFFTSNDEDYALLFDTVAHLNSTSGNTLEVVGKGDFVSETKSDETQSSNEFQDGEILDSLDNFFERINEEGGDYLKKRLQKLANLDSVKQGVTESIESSSESQSEFIQNLRENISLMKEVGNFIRDEGNDILSDSPDSFTGMDELDEWLKERGVDIDDEFENFERQPGPDFSSDAPEPGTPGDLASENQEKDTSRVEFNENANSNPRRG